MHSAFVALIVLVAALFIIANGVLLALWPRYFLRFYDFWARGDYVGRTRSWRKDVEGTEYRLLGVGAIVVGAAMVWDLARAGGWLR